MALSADATIIEETGDFNDYPVKAAETIYKGAMVGEDAASGYARALVAGDLFLGHAWAKADNASGANGDINARVYGPRRYCLQVTITGVALTDLGATVYASDDGTLTLTVNGNTTVGRVARYVTTNTCIVEFQPLGS